MAHGRSSRGLHRSSAFSLLEIIAVLALFGLIAGLLLNGVSTLQANSDDDVEQVTITAVASARHQAVLSGQPVALTHDEENRLLAWGGRQAALIGKDQVRLLPPVRTSAMLVGGKLVEKAITKIHFYPDGTCDPFRIEIVHEQVSRYLTIDPWTCAPLGNRDGGKS